MAHLLVFLISSFHAAHAVFDLTSCNGVEGACELRLEHVTLPGAHNAGAGFDGVLMYHNPWMEALSCFYRNQGASVYDLLNRGVRYLDIDLCYEERDGYDKGVWACHGDAYGGPMTMFLEQVDEWLSEDDNRNDVVVLHFNRDHEQGGNEEKIGDGIIKLLEDQWGPSQSGIRMQSDIGATLGESVADNKRVFIFLHSRLQQHLQSGKPYLFSERFIGYTWRDEKFIGPNACTRFAKSLGSKCSHEEWHKFIRLDFYMPETYQPRVMLSKRSSNTTVATETAVIAKRGMTKATNVTEETGTKRVIFAGALLTPACLDDVATLCNEKLKIAVDKCISSIRPWRTINFMPIDYADMEVGRKQVDIAKDLTKKQVKRRKMLKKKHARRHKKQQ